MKRKRIGLWWWRDVDNAGIAMGVGGMNYTAVGEQIGELVTQKQAQYGDSFGTAPKILVLLYPEGIKPEQYGNLLTIVRVLDKLKRIATQHPSDSEDPWMDIAGYSLLQLAKQKSES